MALVERTETTMTLTFGFPAKPSVFWLIAGGFGAGSSLAETGADPKMWLFQPLYVVILLIAAGFRVRRGRTVICPDCEVGEPHVCSLLDRTRRTT